MKLKKNTQPGKVNIILKLFFFYIFFLFTNFLTIANATSDKRFVEIKILDNMAV